jgi:hypothetical protein
VITFSRAVYQNHQEKEVWVWNAWFCFAFAFDKYYFAFTTVF